MPATTSVHHEIRQSRPFDSPHAEAAVALLRTADLLRRALCALVETQGLTLQQYNVLRILRGAGATGLPTLEIVERLIEHAPGITRLMDRLEAKGLVRRERCPRDRRQVLCWIAPAGLRRLQPLDEPLRLADRSVLGGLSAAQARRLVTLLDRARLGLRERLAPAQGRAPATHSLRPAPLRRHLPKGEPS